MGHSLTEVAWAFGRQPNRAHGPHSLTGVVWAWDMAYQDGVRVGALQAEPVGDVVGPADEVPGEEVHGRPVPLHGAQQALLEQRQVQLALHVLHLLWEEARVLLLLELQQGTQGGCKNKRKHKHKKVWLLGLGEVMHVRVRVLLSLQQGASGASKHK